MKFRGNTFIPHSPFSGIHLSSPTAKSCSESGFPGAALEGRSRDGKTRDGSGFFHSLIPTEVGHLH